MDHVEEPGTGDQTVPQTPPHVPAPEATQPLPPPPAAPQASQLPPPPAYAPPPPQYPPPGYGQQYGQPQYGQAQYPPPGYGQSQYPPPGYGQSQYGQPPALPARRGQQLEMSPGRRKLIAVLGIIGLLAVPAYLGYDLGQRNSGSSSNANSSFQTPSNGFGTSNQSELPNTNGTGAANGTIDATAISDKVDDSVVNITVSLFGGGQAAGTGIVISSNGLVLTNNHVIQNSTSIEAENSASGATWSGKVLGYDPTSDVALVQLEDASGLKAASIGEAASLSVGDPIVALGNAGGHGGAPSVVTGYVTALDQQITAADQDGSNAETLENLVQIDANIQPGDSGGPLVDADGDIVGMNAAASASNGSGFGFGNTGNEGYAIPIEDAVAVAKKIASGQGGEGIHVGAHRALIGVGVNAGVQGGIGQTTRGAVVNSVQSGSAAEKAGIQAGDVITGVDDLRVNSAQELTHALVPYQPDDTVTVTWTDSSGQSHHADVTLGSGPPA